MVAIVLRPPFYVPRPEEPPVWQFSPLPSTLLTPILSSAQTIYGAAGQAPTRQWHYDSDVEEAAWAWTPPLILVLSPAQVGGETLGAFPAVFLM
jgi:hypothetical protein